MSWLGEILWNLWAGLSTVGSVICLLLTGLALFGLFVGPPHLFRLRRQRSAVARALSAITPAVRDRIFAQSRAMGGYPTPEMILAEAPDLRASLAGLGVPPEELLDCILASDAPAAEDHEDSAGEGDLR